MDSSFTVQILLYGDVGNGTLAKSFSQLYKAKMMLIKSEKFPKGSSWKAVFKARSLQNWGFCSCSTSPWVFLDDLQTDWAVGFYKNGCSDVHMAQCHASIHF